MSGNKCNSEIHDFKSHILYLIYNSTELNCMRVKIGRDSQSTNSFSPPAVIPIHIFKFFDIGIQFAASSKVTSLFNRDLNIKLNRENKKKASGFCEACVVWGPPRVIAGVRQTPSLGGHVASSFSLINIRTVSCYAKANSSLIALITIY